MTRRMGTGARARGGGLVAYVTSHGFGHLNRTVAVLNRVPVDVPLTVRGHPSLFDHWGERLTRPAELEPHASDAGAVNPPGDSASTDPEATLAEAARVHAGAAERVAEEEQRLRDGGAAAVLCDVPYVPLVAARRAGVPAYAMGNFTWADIYAPYARALGGDAPRLVSELRRAYREAAALFRMEPGLAMRWFPASRTVNVGLVVAPGRNRSAELRRGLGLARGDRLVYVYLGRYGQNDLAWDRFEALGRRGVHFVGFHAAPGGVGPVPNLHVVSARDWTGADLAASADAAVAKAGYGTVCEVMVAGTPLVYPPRTNFAEHRALDRALRAWGGGVPASARAFTTFRLDAHLDRALALRPGPPPFRADGAAVVARRLTAACRGGKDTKNEIRNSR